MQNITVGKIDTWFPKSVYVIDNLLTDYLPTLETKIKSEAANITANRTSMQQVDSLHIVNDQLHRLPEFQPLVEALQFHCGYYLSQMGYSKEQIETFKMSNMWANVSHKNDYVTPHHHSGAILSGAFYVKTLPDSRIRFYNNPDMFMRPHTYNELNYQYCQYECIPGRLILFRSDFVHGTDRQSEGEKIVISFNITT